MIDAVLLALLRCPQTQTPLAIAPASVVDSLNRQIAAGTLRNVGGRPLTEPLDGGLWRADRMRLYPIVLGVPRLVPEEAVGVEYPTGVEAGADTP